MYYILKKNRSVEATDYWGYASWREYNPSARIVEQTTVGNTMVSTVFLGLDHRMNTSEKDLPPILFETMVFIDGDDTYQTRYTSYQEAYEGHHEVCRKVFAEL